jgi:hypothetical protein
MSGGRARLVKEKKENLHRLPDTRKSMTKGGDAPCSEISSLTIISDATSTSPATDGAGQQLTSQCDLWESTAELDAFIEFTYAQRRAPQPYQLDALIEADREAAEKWYTTFEQLRGGEAT